MHWIQVEGDDGYTRWYNLAQATFVIVGPSGARLDFVDGEKAEVDKAESVARIGRAMQELTTCSGFQRHGYPDPFFDDDEGPDRHDAETHEES